MNNPNLPENIARQGIDADRAATVQFPFDQLDHEDDHLRELIAEHGPRPGLTKTIFKWARSRDEQLRFSHMTDSLDSFLLFFLDDKNPALKLWCYALAFGLPICNGLNQPALARKFRVSKSAVSKRIRECKQMGARSEHTYSAAASESCRRAAVLAHARRKAVA